MLKKLAVLCVVSLVGFSAHSKELANRLGVGVKHNSAIDLAELAAVYYPSADLSFAAGLGVDTQEDYSKFAFNAAVRRIVFKEENLNFYLGGSVGLVNKEVLGDKQSGFELNALFGAEFFFTGLDSLAFTVEGGMGVVSTDNVRFRTIADHPFIAGIIFYF
jgi:hypothetical protein